MIEAVEELIERYQKRCNTLNDMGMSASSDTNRIRYVTKRNVYLQVVDELKQILKDEQDKT